ncbi:Uncharacterized protein FWK35_00034953 [Aphis craccivora]|uniref:Uncharacterized protein n=1 Tax=Aphis craccivora TaxID=307492 RepID=A0A6G0YG67_APHCR|nr:Uncharacterized protein FWK35_00034953 [Aphis craccivora]
MSLNLYAAVYAYASRQIGFSRLTTLTVVHRYHRKLQDAVKPCRVWSRHAGTVYYQKPCIIRPFRAHCPVRIVEQAATL